MNGFQTHWPVFLVIVGTYLAISLAIGGSQFLKSKGPDISDSNNT